MSRVLITGTTQGIGAAIYQRFIIEGYEVYTVNRRTFGDESHNLICDLSNVEETQMLCNTIRRLDIDMLINNAGGGEPMRFQNISGPVLIACTNLNYHAPVLLMQAVLEGMKAKGYGRIVNISSIASKSPRTLIPHYAAAKAALEAFSKSLAVAYMDCGVTINCICPGGVRTKTSLECRKKMALLSGEETDFYNKAMSRGNGLGRLVEPSEIVDAVMFFVSEGGRAISGQTLNVCGVKEVHG